MAHTAKFLLVILVTIFVGVKGKVELSLCQGFSENSVLGDLHNGTLVIPTGTSANLNDEDLHFRLRSGRNYTLSCSKNNSWNEYTVKFLNESKPPILIFGNIPEAHGAILPAHLTPDGHLYDGTFYHMPNSFCIKSVTDTEVVLLVCPINCNDPLTICVPKCCALDEVMDFWRLECKKVNESMRWKPLVHNEQHLKFDKQVQLYRHNFEGCDEQLHSWDWAASVDVINLKKNVITIKDNISLIVRKRLELDLLDKTDRRFKTVELPYCADGFTTEWEPYSGIADHQMFMYCETKPPFNSALAWSYAITSIISTVFLMLILLVYLALWDKLNTQGLIIFSYTGSTLGSYFFASVAQLSSLFPNLVFSSNAGPCIGLAILMHYFYLANFLWLTVMNIDLWMTFRSMEHPSGKKSSSLTLYSVCAWGTALVLIAVFCAMDEIFSDPESQVPVPDYGKSVCFVSKAFRGHYVYSPMGILVVVNLVLIGLTMHIFCTARKTYTEKFSETKKPSDGSTKANKYSPELFIKLFLMMGGTSVVDFATWYYNSDVTPWYIATLENLSYLLPVALFKVFCINNRVLGQLEEKFPKWKKCWKVLRRVA